MNSPYYECPDDSITLESLQSQLDELQAKLFALTQYVSDTLNACACEHCGCIHPRKEMLALYGVYTDPSGGHHPESSRWFCGFCLYAVAAFGPQQYRDMVGKWFAVGAGRKWFAKNGPVNGYPNSSAEQIRREFEPEIMAAGKRYMR